MGLTLPNAFPLVLAALVGCTQPAGGPETSDATVTGRDAGSTDLPAEDTDSTGPDPDMPVECVPAPSGDMIVRWQEEYADYYWPIVASESGDELGLTAHISDTEAGYEVLDASTGEILKVEVLPKLDGVPPGSVQRIIARAATGFVAFSGAPGVIYATVFGSDGVENQASFQGLPNLAAYNNSRLLVTAQWGESEVKLLGAVSASNDPEGEDDVYGYWQNTYAVGSATPTTSWTRDTDARVQFGEFTDGGVIISASYDPSLEMATTDGELVWSEKTTPDPRYVVAEELDDGRVLWTLVDRELGEIYYSGIGTYDPQTDTHTTIYASEKCGSFLPVGARVLSNGDVVLVEASDSGPQVEQGYELRVTRVALEDGSVVSRASYKRDAFLVGFTWIEEEGDLEAAIVDAVPPGTSHTVTRLDPFPED